MEKNVKTKKQYILDFFKNHPRKKYQLKEIDEIVKAEYQKDTGTTDIYVNRGVRALGTQGYIPELKGVIEKPDRGSYLFRPGHGKLKPKSPFSQIIKEKIKKRDNYQCQWCKTKETVLDIFGGFVSTDLAGKKERKIGFTLRVGGGRSPINDRRNWDGYIVNKKVVRINSEQGRQMMGFPKTFKMPVSENQAMKQLGNSVAVNVVKAIGKEIEYHLKNYSK